MPDHVSHRCEKQMPSSYYEPYAQRLATWGYVCMQYDLPGKLLKKTIPDDQEVI